MTSKCGTQSARKHVDKNYGMVNKKRKAVTCMRRGAEKHKYLQKKLNGGECANYIPELEEVLNEIVGIDNRKSITFYSEVPFNKMWRQNASSRVDIVGYSSKARKLIFIEYKTSDVLRDVTKQHILQVRRCHTNFITAVAARRFHSKYTTKNSDLKDVEIHNLIVLRFAQKNSNGKIDRHNVVKRVKCCSGVNIYRLNYDLLFKDFLCERRKHNVNFDLAKKPCTK
jgi:hypothetical protein